MSKYNEQHATTMLNALIETDTLADHDKQIRDEAIDDFVEKFSLEISESLIWGILADWHKHDNMNDTPDKIVDYVIETSKKIAEQLKTGGENES